GCSLCFLANNPSSCPSANGRRDAVAAVLPVGQMVKLCLGGYDDLTFLKLELSQIIARAPAIDDNIGCQGKAGERKVPNPRSIIDTLCAVRHERLKPLQVRNIGRGRYQYQKARRFPGYEGLTSERMAFQEDRSVRQRNNIEGPEEAYQNPAAALCFHFAE